jgi:hypothetical protein
MKSKVFDQSLCMNAKIIAALHKQNFIQFCNNDNTNLTFKE